MEYIAIKVTLIFSLIGICYQDHKYRAVWWFIFPIFFFTAGFLFFSHIENLYFLNIGFNLLILSTILSISYVYALYKMKVKFLNGAFGIGDLFFFLGVAVAFPTITFVILFVFSLFFSLLLHFILSKTRQETVPLAGYASLFFIFIYLSDWLGFCENLYII